MTEGNRAPVRTQLVELRFVSRASLRCPNCSSTNLKRVSLAYREGLSYLRAHTRLRVVAVVGSGPDLVIGKATTRGFHQSVLSKQLAPPVKWSYRKLTLWWAVVFLSIGWIVFYINTFTKGSSAVLSAPLVLFSGLSAVMFLLLLVLFWNHNQSAYKRRYSQVVPLPTLWHCNGAGILVSNTKSPTLTSPFATRHQNNSAIRGQSRRLDAAGFLPMVCRWSYFLRHNGPVSRRHRQRTWFPRAPT